MIFCPIKFIFGLRNKCFLGDNLEFIHKGNKFSTEEENKKLIKLEESLKDELKETCF
jgi:hypothetical protein